MPYIQMHFTHAGAGWLYKKMPPGMIVGLTINGGGTTQQATLSKSSHKETASDDKEDVIITVYATYQPTVVLPMPVVNSKGEIFAGSYNSAAGETSVVVWYA